MSGNQLGVLIIGTGWVSGEHIKAYQANPHAEILALCDTDVYKARAARDRHGLQCMVSNKFKDFLGDEKIDVVSVCTPHHLHFEQAKACLEAGKNVMVEKPLCVSYEEAKGLKEAAEKSKAKTAVGFVARWYSAIKALKKMSDSGMIGDPFYIESDYWHEVAPGWKSTAETAGTALLTGGVHAVDMMRYFAKPGNEVVEVFGYAIKPRRRLDFTYDPTICLMAKFADGCIGKVGTSLELSMPYVFHLQVLGTEGAIRGPQIYSEKLLDEDSFMQVPGVYPDNFDVQHHPFDEEIDYFIDCIVNDRTPMISIEDAFKTHEIAFAAERSAETGKPVSIPYHEDMMLS